MKAATRQRPPCCDECCEPFPDPTGRVGGCGYSLEPPHGFDGEIKAPDYPMGTIFRCYACSSRREHGLLLAHGSGTLYLSHREIPRTPSNLENSFTVSDWTGLLKAAVHSYKPIHHNIAWRSKNYFVTFKLDGDPFLWSGRCIGDMDCFRVRRTQRRA